MAANSAEVISPRAKLLSEPALVRSDFSPSRDTLIRQSENFLALYVSGRFRELASICTEDCELHLGGAVALSPFAGLFKGREAVRGKLQELGTQIEMLECTPMNFVVDGFDVVITVETRMCNRGSGSAPRCEGVFLLRFAGELIASIGNFADTAAVARLTEWPTPS